MIHTAGRALTETGSVCAIRWRFPPPDEATSTSERIGVIGKNNIRLKDMRKSPKYTDNSSGTNSTNATRTSQGERRTASVNEGCAVRGRRRGADEVA